MRNSRLAGGLAALAVLLVLLVSAPLAVAANLPPQNPRAASLAAKCLGVPYLSGGTNRSGFDAPGFVHWVYLRRGVRLPLDLTRQMNRGVEVPRDQLKPGDAVFFPSDSGRVGIYVGGDQMIGTDGPGSVVSKTTIHWSATSTKLRRYAARTGLRAVRIAQRYLGVPYVWGGASPSGFDSSGLTKYVYARLGVKLLHGATDQQRSSRRVRLGRLKPGDLVFFGSKKYSYHVGIYVGGGSMIDAPHTGAVVQFDSISGAWTGGRFLPAR